MEFLLIVFWIGLFVLVLVVVVIVFFIGQSLFVVGGVMIVGGFGLLCWWLGFLCGSCQKKFIQEFVNLFDVIVCGVKFGLLFNECFKIIVNELFDLVGFEFKQFCDGIVMGVLLEENFNCMCECMFLVELNFFCIVLIIQQKIGGNLVEILGNFFIVLCLCKLMREKISVLLFEVKFFVVIIGFLLLGVLGIVYVIMFFYMNFMFVYLIGQLMLLGGVIWMFMGIMVMCGMINFKIQVGYVWYWFCRNLGFFD